MEKRAEQLVAVLVVFSVVGTLAIALRLWTRLIIIKAPGPEDWVLFTSWLFACATTVLMGIQVNYGLGSHGDTLSTYQVEKLAFCIYVSIITYCASMGLTKFAILLQYQRVFKTRWFQVVLWIFIVIINIHTITTVVLSIFPCKPIKKAWIPTIEGKCNDRTTTWLYNSVMNIITDFIIILLPIPVVRSLQLPPKQKALLIGIFGVGLVVCIISIIRLHTLIVASRSTDPAFDNGPIASFSAVEMYVAILCASLPGLKSLLAKWITGLISTKYGSHSSAKAGGCSHGPNCTGHKRTSALPGLSSRGIALGTVRGRDGREEMDDETSEDKIKVLTRVEVSISQESGRSCKGSMSAKDERESSTETLFRDGRYGV